MKATILPQGGTSTDPISCVKFSRKKRELHASPRREITDSLTISTGIAAAKGCSVKKIITMLVAVLCLWAAPLQAHAQGQMIDQQSWTGPINIQTPDVDGLYLTDQQEGEDFEQTFIPSLSAIDFVALEFESSTGPATIEVNLYEGSPSITGQTLLGTSAAITMPAGFENSGVGSGGVEDFYFANPISLTPGNEYYFQPVLISGGALWAYVTIVTDTYPNGELDVDGSPFVINTDMWFQEGIEDVPEPGTSALIGFTCLLAFIYRRYLKLPQIPPLVLVCSLFAIPVLSIRADSVVQATADAAGLTPVSPTSSPLAGTFWVTTVNPNGGFTTLPYPILPSNMTELPTFLITNSIYLVDDTDGQISPASSERMTTDEASATVQAESQTIENLIEMEDDPPVPGSNDYPEGTNFPPFMLNALPPIADTTNIWLLGTNDSLDIGLMLENPTGNNYQLLSTTNLLGTNWNLGQILTGPYPGYNNVFNSVPHTNTMMFFRVHQANPIIGIFSGQTAIEPTNSDSGQVGVFYINNEANAAPSNTTVYFTISGTAQNGADYSNITDSAVMPANQNQVQINIDPLINGFEPNKTIIITLTQNADYLIDPANDLSTNSIQANPQVYPIINGDTLTLCPNSTWPVFLQAHDPRGLALTYTIVTWPSHGYLNTNTAPTCYYTSSNCFEGADSFTYSVSDGQFAAGPATINLNVADTIFAYQISTQTCRGTTVGIKLFGGNSCQETTNYAILSNPGEGSLRGTPPNLTYTPTGTNFTGVDSFDYIVYDECDTATNTVTITVGDAKLHSVGQTFMTGTNQPLTITLHSTDSDSCNDDSNNYVYTIINGPTNGTLRNTGTNFSYVPNSDFEGIDSFQFTASDGVWTNAASTITIFVVAGPILNTECDPFGTAVQLNWALDTNVLAMEQSGLYLNDFVLSRSTNSGGPFTPIYTVTGSNTSETNYWDTNSVVGQPYYYVINFQGAISGVVYESPLSSEVAASGQTNDDFIPADAYWEVVTNLLEPQYTTMLQMPMSQQYQYGEPYPYLYPLPNSEWTSTTTWSNYTTLVIPTNTIMSQVKYSIAIDNYYILYVNGTNIGYGNNGNTFTTWSHFENFPTNVLHYGTNSVAVRVSDTGEWNYFSMVVTTNTCGW